MGTIKMIAASNIIGGIGNKGELFCKSPEDLKYFKMMTTGSVVVMGRKTWESIGSKPLKNRTNVVISTKYRPCNQIEDEKTMSIFVNNESALRDLIDTYLEYGDVWIIGGATLYDAFANDAEKVYLTKFTNVNGACDTFVNLFMNLITNKDPRWECENPDDPQKVDANGHLYHNFVYKRIM